MKKSCVGCNLRQVGCHGECQKYAEWSNEEHNGAMIDYIFGFDKGEEE